MQVGVVFTVEIYNSKFVLALAKICFQSERYSLLISIRWEGHNHMQVYWAIGIRQNLCSSSSDIHGTCERACTVTCQCVLLFAKICFQLLWYSPSILYNSKFVMAFTKICFHFPLGVIFNVDFYNSKFLLLILWSLQIDIWHDGTLSVTSVPSPSRDFNCDSNGLYIMDSQYYYVRTQY